MILTGSFVLKRLSIGFGLLLILNLIVLSQNKPQKNKTTYKEDKKHDYFFKNFSDHVRNDRQIRVLFYNVENFFDLKDDTLKKDKPFLPGGVRGWNAYRYQNKLNKVAKTLHAAGGWQPPELIGLCEIENRTVINDLIQHPSFENFNYGIVHYESPDRRGIDVALLYDKQKVTVLESKPIRVHFPWNPNSKTRDILYVQAQLPSKDTFHVFVNHWPSRWGGKQSSEKRRVRAATTLKDFTDRIFMKNDKANILIMGDFNDNPFNKSISNVLVEASTDSIKNNNGKLVNLMDALHNEKGTHKFHGKWSTLDQFLVSQALTSRQNGWNIKNKSGKVFNPNFLLEEDEKYMGIKPYRTYHGYQYHGGFSDHLPVYVDFKYLNE